MAKNKVSDTFTQMFADNKFSKDDMFVKDNLMYEVIAGSFAYGANNPDSDYDIVGIFMDKHRDLYPQNYGYVLGFDTEMTRMSNLEFKGKNNRLIHKNREVEAEWKSLTRFFYLAAQKGSPNMVEMLFVRKQNIKFIHPAFYPIKDNASKFISMRNFHAFKGFLHSQFHRIKKDAERGKTENPLRQQYIDKYQFDVKMAYHVLRLIDILMQMLDGETDLDLMRNKEECKAMRRGDWGTWDDFVKYTNEKFTFLDNKAGDCKLPTRPRVDELRNILNNSIEEWYGTDNGTQVRERQFVSVEEFTRQMDRMETGIASIQLANGMSVASSILNY